jgi:hypothetical protein
MRIKKFTHFKIDFGDSLREDKSPKSHAPALLEVSHMLTQRGVAKDTEFELSCDGSKMNPDDTHWSKNGDEPTSLSKVHSS